MKSLAFTLILTGTLASGASAQTLVFETADGSANSVGGTPRSRSTGRGTRT